MKKDPFLYVATFLMDGLIGVIGLCVPLLALRLGATYDDLGAIGAVSSLVYALACLVSGRLSERLGYRRSTALASAAVALSVACYPRATRVLHLIALYTLTWVCLSCYWPALQAWLGSGKGRRDLLRGLGRFNISWALGLLVGPAVGGSLYAMDLDWPFLIAAGAIGLLSLFIVFLRLQAPPQAPASEAPPEDAASDHFLRLAYVANFATFFATGTVRSLFPKFASDLGIAPGPLGLLMALIGLAQVVTFFLVARADRWQFRLSPLVASQVAGAAGLLTLAFGASPGVFAVGLLAHGALTGLTFTASIFYSLFVRNPGSRRTGLHEAVVGGGFFLGPLLGGIAAEHLGPRSPYLLSAAFILLAVGLQAGLHRAWVQSRESTKAVTGPGSRRRSRVQGPGSRVESQNL
jgi:MFS family permease